MSSSSHLIQDDDAECHVGDEASLTSKVMPLEVTQLPLHFKIVLYPPTDRNIMWSGMLMLRPGVMLLTTLTKKWASTKHIHFLLGRQGCMLINKVDRAQTHNPDIPDRHLRPGLPPLGGEDEAVGGDEEKRGECHEVADAGVLPSRSFMSHSCIGQGMKLATHLIMLSRINTLAAHEERVNNTVARTVILEMGMYFYTISHCLVYFGDLGPTDRI